MDHRILFAVAVGLVLVAVGGFYFALKPGSHDPVVHPVQKAAGPAPAAQNQSAQNPAAQAPAAPAAKATAASIEAEIAQSDHAELQGLLKKHFAKEYDELIAVAVRRRNEGVKDEAFGQELFTHFQEIMRSKLKFAVGASTPMIDSLAANEVNLFHALGAEGPGFCLKVLGKDDTPAETPLPENIRRMMRLGTLYRFRAIVEGMPSFKPIDPLTADEIVAFDASLARDSLTFDEVRSGAFLSKQGNEPGKPCLMVEKLYLAIARLGEGTRRKLYAGMFFLGRDQ